MRHLCVFADQCTDSLRVVFSHESSENFYLAALCQLSFLTCNTDHIIMCVKFGNNNVRRITGARLCWCVCVCVYGPLFMCTTRAALYLKTRQYFIDGFPLLLHSSLPGPRPPLKTKLSSAHFSTRPHVQVLIKLVPGLGGLGAFLVEWDGGVGLAAGRVKATNFSDACFWFGISLGPCCTVTHTRPLAQSSCTKMCLTSKLVSGNKLPASTYPEKSDL